MASAKDIYRPAARDWPAKKLYPLVLLAGVVLYGLTAQRGPAWQDSGMHQWRALTGQWTNELGLALAHPLLIAMAQPVRWLCGDGAAFTLWMNRLSALGMAIALANVYLLGYWLTGRQLAGLLAAALLGLSHTAWWLATISETYCWTTAGLTGELVLLVWLIARPHAGKLVALALVNGLGLSMHNLALLPLPVYILAGVLLVAHRRVGWQALPAAAAAWLAGAALYLGLVLHQGFAGGDWGGTIRSALFGEQWQKDVLNTNLHSLGRAGLYVLLNWPFLSLLPVLIGWWAMPRNAGRSAGAALGAVAAIELIFAIRYSVPDQFMFLLPTHALLAIGAAVGVDRIRQMRPAPRRLLTGLVVGSLLATPVLYGLAPPLMNRWAIAIRPGRLPLRDENRYWITPWKSDENSAERFARQALEGAPPSAVILADGTAEYPLRLTQRLQGVRPEPDVTVAPLSPDLAKGPEALRTRFAGRPILVTGRARAVLADKLKAAVRFMPAGVLDRLEFVEPAPSP